MADKKISELVTLTGPVTNSDFLAIADDSASLTKKINPASLIEQGVLVIGDGTIPSAKVAGSTIAQGSITTGMLADEAVTAAKLADNSSGHVSTALPVSGEFIGQVALMTATGRFYAWDGSTWFSVKAAGSVNQITTTTGGLLEITITQTGDSVNIVTEFADTANASEFLAGPTNGGGAISARVIEGDDLPTASNSVKGGVQVGGDGLRMDGDKIEIDNDIDASNGFELGEFNSKGLATQTRAIAPSDLPIATSLTPGIVRPGQDLAVEVDGTINPPNRLPAGTYTKVTCTGTGIITAGSQLQGTDIPGFDASKVATGELDPARIGDHTLASRKLNDYASCLMQEDHPGSDSSYYLGLLWYKPSSTQLYIYAKGSGPENIWLPVADFGQLQNINLRWVGGVNATNGEVTLVTNEGVQNGYQQNQVLPIATDSNSGCYLLVTEAGNGIPVHNVLNQPFSVGDWCLSLGSDAGYIKINITDGGGGGGGGGAEYLGQLLDVTLGGVTQIAPSLRIALGAGQFLKYMPDQGMWVNDNVIDGNETIIELNRADVATPPAQQNIREGELLMRTSPDDPAVYFKDSNNVVQKLSPGGDAVIDLSVTNQTTTSLDVTPSGGGTAATLPSVTDTYAGLMSCAQKAELDSINLDKVNFTAGVALTLDAVSSPNVLNCDESTTSALGVVQLADAAAIAAGTAGRVVDAAQLKAQAGLWEDDGTTLEPVVQGRGVKVSNADGTENTVIENGAIVTSGVIQAGSFAIDQLPDLP